MRTYKEDETPEFTGHRQRRIERQCRRIMAEEYRLFASTYGKKRANGDVCVDFNKKPFVDFSKNMRDANKTRKRGDLGRLTTLTFRDGKPTSVKIAGKETPYADLPPEQQMWIYHICVCVMYCQHKGRPARWFTTKDWERFMKTDFTTTMMATAESIKVQKRLFNKSLAVWLARLMPDFSLLGIDFGPNCISGAFDTLQYEMSWRDRYAVLFATTLTPADGCVLFNWKHVKESKK